MLPGLAGAQTPLAGAQTGFVPPWAVTFADLDATTKSRLGSYYLEQVRRRRTETPSGPAFPGTLERVLYRAANSQAKTAEQFRIEFAGLEGRILDAAGFAAEKAKFDLDSGFQFRFASFRVDDPRRADQVYELVFLAHGNRATKEGIRAIYRMAVLPRKWDRNGWLLELDAGTGFPLYAGEYSLDGPGAPRLESEVIVFSFLPDVRVPDATDPSWWTPALGIEEQLTDVDAVRKALPNATAHVVPTSSELPAGYLLARSEVQTDPYTGERKALLTYSDGLDHVFVLQRATAYTKRGDSDEIMIHRSGGFTRCLFKHHGVEFFVVGRSAGDRVRRLAAGVFGQAIRVL